MSLSVNVEQPEISRPVAQYDVVVMGAGPYGLSVSAHLRARGLKVATFGKPLLFWRKHMPQGMLLRSYWWATGFSDPDKKYSIQRYFAQQGTQPCDPLPIQTVIDYGLWFQQHTVPDLDETYIANIERKDSYFLVTLEDGRIVQSKAVVMAPGLHYYFYCPPEYEHMPSSLVSHSADHSDLSIFAGKRVAVIGRGQAALESAALLHEQDAEVCVIARNPILWFSSPSGPVKQTPALIKALRSPRASLGSGWGNLITEKFPYLWHHMPYDTRYRLFDRHHGPIGARWLKPRVVGQLPLKEQVQMTNIEAVNDQAQLTLSNGEVVEVDHVLLATGYRADVSRLSMLDASLRASIQVTQGAPVLNRWFESSVAGLYFIGFSSQRSFGDFYRFVAGAGAASSRVSKAIVRHAVRSQKTKTIDK